MRFLLALAALVIAGDTMARPFQRSRQRYSYETSTKTTPRGTITRTTESFRSSGPVADALGEVNAARAARGLKPFLRDEGLMQAARDAAQDRAVRRIAGHTSNDFAYLPPGSFASAAGCAALAPSWGFQACCQYENWTYAGAATIRGTDGRLYHHLFVR